MVRKRSEPLGERPGERGRPRPPFLDGRGAVGRRQRAHLDVGEPGLREQARELVGILEREGPGDPGRRHLRAELGGDRVEDDAEPGVRLAGPPDRERDAAAGPQDAPDLAQGAGRVGDEHEPLAAEHGVVRAVRLVDPFEIEIAGADVAQAECLRPPTRDRCHLGGDVRQDDLPARADELGRGEPCSARTASELEDPGPGPEPRPLEQALGHGFPASVDERCVYGPAAGDRTPHAPEPGPELVGCHVAVRRLHHPHRFHDTPPILDTL